MQIIYRLACVHTKKAVLAMIFFAMLLEMVGTLMGKRTDKEAWYVVKVMLVGVDFVREATVKRLCKDFEVIAFRDKVTLDSFGMQIMALVKKPSIPR
jgi:hypothetical protein